MFCPRITRPDSTRRRVAIAPLAAGSILFLLPMVADARASDHDSPAGPGDLEAVVDLHDDMMVPPDWAVEKLTAKPDRDKFATDVIFLNYDGAQLTKSNNYQDDARNNVSWICGGNYPAWGNDPTKKEALIQAFLKDWEAYDVTTVTQRPATGNYTMNMIGPGSQMCGINAGGIAPVDCYNQEANSVTFTFTGANGGFGVNGEATIYSQEVAHSFGLEHVTDSTDIMNPSANGSDQFFHDKCIPITGSNYCSQQHSDHCGSGSQQNAVQELLDILGPKSPDVTAPLIEITYPADGEVFEEGANFQIEVEATDDKAVGALELWVNGADTGQRDATAPYGWSASNIGVGEFELQVVGSDLAGNSASSNIVTFTVAPAGSGDSGGSSASGTTGDSGSASGGDSGNSGGALTTTDSDGLPPGFGGDGQLDDGSCACTAEQEGPRGLGLLAVLFAGGLIRRRRS